ncbi:hypothetical protein CDG76_30400 [Nostoc sp. 'Peltigera membranacea cyanobiont' 210A]|uniref:hypothetical protein n=1 Tax=Nostoc sp. 'Peltigera membranacea cyanobiont' 210A TaxID=2014529 RepID=UPI000B95310D|nr:hypothetical protein [Nostoc sp. 'Peltigera membranacea cyanobiont' 210A]OYD90540.1 hypothetical protein CDG76_30400 [Nostoc sp. 'Peltigera membranacea cyanobiont' 210A]
MQSANTETQYVVCINNKGYPASLEIRKIYQTVPDSDAVKHQMIRVIDESGEDYLYPSNYFVLIELPKAVTEAFSLAS